MIKHAAPFQDSDQHRAMRQALVDIIAQKEITSMAVLDAIRQVPRHFFVPPGVSPEEAYADKALPIAEGQTISQPYTVAYQTQLLEVRAGQKILEVGTGSGYQAAVLCWWPVSLYTIEYNNALYTQAKQLLAELNYPVHTFHGDGSQGLPTYAPFDRILVTAGAPEVPEVLLQQLAIEGKMVIPVGKPKNQQMLQITRKATQEFDTELFDLFSFVPLLGKYGWK